MIFLSTDPNAELVEIEYFIDKKLARTNVTLEQWNKHFHDHKRSRVRAGAGLGCPA